MIEYFYAAHSAFAYLGSARLSQIAAAAGRRIDHRPYDLRRALDVIRGPMLEAYDARHNAYFFGREIERWAEWRSAPVMGHRPTHHDNDITLPNCLLIAAIESGTDVDALAHTLLEAHWRDDVDLAREDTLMRLAESAGLEARSVLDAARSPEVAEIYRANTDEAIRRSVFGSPTYFVDGDMFYGQDRLEMLERALTHRFSGDWPLTLE